MEVHAVGMKRNENCVARKSFSIPYRNYICAQPTNIGVGLLMVWVLTCISNRVRGNVTKMVIVFFCHNVYNEVCMCLMFLAITTNVENYLAVLHRTLYQPLLTHKKKVQDLHRKAMLIVILSLKMCIPKTVAILIPLIYTDQSGTRCFRDTS